MGIKTQPSKAHTGSIFTPTFIRNIRLRVTAAIRVAPTINKTVSTQNNLTCVRCSVLDDQLSQSETKCTFLFLYEGN